MSYAAERVIGNGSFGVVFQAVVVETGEVVAIKKVLQDRRFKVFIFGLFTKPHRYRIDLEFLYINPS